MAIGTDFRLGLIGDGIGRSSAPRLHELAGRIVGRSVRYDRFDLDGRTDTSFEDTLARCGRDGLAGVNVTHPYKERAAAIVPVADAGVRRIGAINTVLFRDVIVRHAVSQVAALRWIIRHALRNPCGSFSATKLHDDLRSQGHNVAKDTVHALAHRRGVNR